METRGLRQQSWPCLDHLCPEEWQKGMRWGGYPEGCTPNFLSNKYGGPHTSDGLLLTIFDGARNWDEIWEEAGDFKRVVT